MAPSRFLTIRVGKANNDKACGPIYVLLLEHYRLHDGAMPCKIQ